MKLAVDRDLFLVATVAGRGRGHGDGRLGRASRVVCTVAVAPAHRHRGIGTALIRHLEAELGKRGCLKINLQVRTSNAEVIAFYSKLGYSVDDVLSLGKRLY